MLPSQQNSFRSFHLNRLSFHTKFTKFSIVILYGTNSQKWRLNTGWGLIFQAEVERLIFEDPAPDTGFMLHPDLKWVCGAKAILFVVYSGRSLTFIPSQSEVEMINPILRKQTLTKFKPAIYDCEIFDLFALPWAAPPKWLAIPLRRDWCSVAGSSRCGEPVLLGHMPQVSMSSGCAHFSLSPSISTNVQLDSILQTSNPATE